MEKAIKTSKEILKAIGGQENISAMEHCATRLRIVLKNQSIVSSREVIENISGIKGYIFKNNQHQFILGTGFVNKVFSVIKNDNLLNLQSMEEAVRDKTPVFQRAVKNLSSIFISIIPVIVATGLFMGIRGFLVDGLHLQLSDNLLRLSQVMTDLPFVFIPVLVTWAATKKFGGNPVIGIVLGLMLVAPQLPNKWDVSFGKIDPMYLHVLGLKLRITGFQSSILPAIFMGWFASNIEKKLRKFIPEMIDLIVTPFLTLLTSLIMGLIIVGPFLLSIEKLITKALLYFLQLPYGIGGLAYGGLIQILVIGGMHHTLVPAILALMAQTGVDYVQPMGTAAIAGQLGAGLAILTISKKSKKANLLAACIPAIFGISEPIMFGVTLPKVKPFIAGCIGGGIGGMIAAIMHLGSAGTGLSMLSGLLLYIGNGFFKYILVMIVSSLIGFTLTKLMYKGKVI